MFEITLLAMGKLKEKFYISATEEYTKRLKGYCKLTLVELPEAKLSQDPSAGEISAALEKEAEAIRAKIPQGASVIAMCVEGKMRSSEELAKCFSRFALEGKSQLTFLIGGSVGLHQSLKAQADVRLSMSPMTFPHHLARVMLLEQIYRGYQILEGSRYHK